MATVEDILSSVKRLALDTAPIIYFVEANPRYDTIMTAIFQRIANGDIEAVTSALTLTEVLALPMQKQRSDLCRAYKTLLTSAEHFTLVSIDGGIAERAAELRARYQLRTPDALQIATSLAKDCQAFLTNDKSLHRITEIPVVVLETFL